MPIDAVVLVSVGRHPASGRARRADLDARALELALRQGIVPRVLHAGDAGEPALREYLGMGIGRLTVLAQPAEADALPALLGHARETALVLAGSRAETGEGSGFLPYALAHALGAALVPDIVDLKLTADGAELVQSVAGGRRRALGAGFPLVVTVGPAAPEARAVAYGPARRGTIERIDVARPEPDPLRGEWRELPARPRPRRLKIVAGASAAERLKAATEMQAGRGRLLVHPAPEEAARAILDYLADERILER